MPTRWTDEDPHMAGHGVFTFDEDGGGSMDWSIQRTSGKYAVMQAHNLPLVPEGENSLACWGGRWSPHEYLSGTGFDTLNGITADDIAKDTGRG
jgi:hypothetical protein